MVAHTPRSTRWCTTNFFGVLCVSYDGVVVRGDGDEQSDEIGDTWDAIRRLLQGKVGV